MRSRREFASDAETFEMNVIDSLKEFLRERLLFKNKDLLSALEAFIKFDDPNTIKKAHELFCCDLDMASPYLQFCGLCEQEQVKTLSIDQIVKHPASPDRIIHFRELATILACIFACTPHSADVERCISGNNLLKTNIRSSLALATENENLYLHFNMPALELWDPRSAIIKWIFTSRRSRSPPTTGSRTSEKQAFYRGVFENCDSAKFELRMMILKKLRIKINFLMQ